MTIPRSRFGEVPTASENRDAALFLQRGFLPPPPPVIENVRVAARYLAGTVGTQVGGDWYDVIPLGAGRVAFVVGDVMGRGLAAAAVMGQLRAMIRGYAQLDLGPAEVLGLLDKVVATLGGEDSDFFRIATCVYAIYDPSREELRVASAGHPPVVVASPDGTVDIVVVEPAPPLGIGPGSNAGFSDGQMAGHAPAEQTVPVVAGSLVVLFTDGLVEDRHRDLDEGIEQLRRSLRWQDDAEAVADGLLDVMAPRSGYTDDLALLVARLPVPRRQALRTSLVLVGGPAATWQMRAHVRRTLAGWNLDPNLIDDVVMVCGELVTNALRHAEPPADIGLLLADDRLVVEVRDGSLQRPSLRASGSDDEGGRGLHIVNRLSERWGTRLRRDGKVVWAEFQLV